MSLPGVLAKDKLEVALLRVSGKLGTPRIKVLLLSMAETGKKEAGESQTNSRRILRAPLTNAYQLSNDYQ